MANFNKMTYMGMESMTGLIKESIKESGKRIRCMGKATSLGLMAGNTLE